MPITCFIVGFGACWLLVRYEATVRKLVLGYDEAAAGGGRALSDTMSDDQDTLTRTSHY